MPLLGAIFAVLLVASVGVGVAAYRGEWLSAASPSAIARRSADRWGSVPAAAVILGLGAAVTFAVSIGLGFLAKALESPVDQHVFTWVHSRVKVGSFTKLNAKLTNIGLNSNVQLVVLFAVIALAFAYKRRWYLSPLLIIGMFYLERYWQRWLAKIVHRGHPPTTHGTFPSGGVARILAVYGMIIALTICIVPVSRAWRAGLWIALVTAAVLEAFTRVYLSLHWFTDAAFALPFGSMLCLTAIMTATAITYQNDSADRQRESTPAVGTPA